MGIYNIKLIICIPILIIGIIYVLYEKYTVSKIKEGYKCGIVIYVYNQNISDFEIICSYKQNNNSSSLDNIDFNNNKEVLNNIKMLFKDKENTYCDDFIDSDKKMDCSKIIDDIISNNKYFTVSYNQKFNCFDVIFANDIFKIIGIFNTKDIDPYYSNKFFFTTEKMKNINVKYTFNDLIDNLLNRKYIDVNNDLYKNFKENSNIEFYIRSYNKLVKNNKITYEIINKKIENEDLNKHISDFQNVYIKYPTYCEEK